MGAALWAIVVLLYYGLGLYSALNEDVAGTIFFCFTMGVGLWQIQKIKDGDNE